MLARSASLESRVPPDRQAAVFCGRLAPDENVDWMMQKLMGGRAECA